MLRRMRFGMALEKKGCGSASRKKMGDGGQSDTAVEVDETFIGGKKRNMHKDKKVRYEARGGAFGKTIVQGMLDRNAREVRAKVVPNVTRETLQTEILKNVKYGTKIY